jgi:glutamate 5-kinase
MESSLKCGVIPIVNENDSISIKGITFTDNDELAGLVASMIDADAVVIMTSVDGLYTGDPEDPKNKLIKSVKPQDEDLSSYISSTKTSLGRGGMATKCKVAKRMSQVGIGCHFINGKKKNNLIKLVKGEEIGTLFIPTQKKPFKQKWISHSSGFEKGVIYVDSGIEELLKSPEKKVSILPVGIYKVEGEFEKGEVVKVCNQKKQTIGYGISQFDSDEIFEKLKQSGEKPVIRYDNLFMER